MKDLPKVFANQIKKDINPSQNFYYGNNYNMKKDIDVLKKIDNIFSDRNYIYKSIVKITTNKGINEETIIGKTKDSLITMNGNLIKINSIIDIEKI